jgi:hypothetical protein
LIRPNETASDGAERAALNDGPAALPSNSEVAKGAVIDELIIKSPRDVGYRFRL